MTSYCYGPLPWAPERQLYCDLNQYKNTLYSTKGNSFFAECHGNDHIKKIDIKNKVEAYWDQKTLGLLSSKTGSFKGQQG